MKYFSPLTSYRYPAGKIGTKADSRYIRPAVIVGILQVPGFLRPAVHPNRACAVSVPIPHYRDPAGINRSKADHLNIAPTIIIGVLQIPLQLRWNIESYRTIAPSPFPSQSPATANYPFAPPKFPDK